MSANPNTAAPTGRNKPAQGKERSDDALGHVSQDTSSPEGAKDGSGLPSGWRCQSLGQQCNILAGFGFPERFQGKPSGDLPFYKVGDISETWKRGDTFLTRANHYVSHADARELRAKPLPANTTVFAKIGAAIALNRRAILSEASLVDNNVMGLHPGSDGLDFKFLFHFVCTLKLDELSRATTVPSIRKSDIEAIALPLPPLPEQRRIVAEIEKQFTRLEAGVAALRRVQANLKRYRAAVLKAACEGKLVPTEAELRKAEVRRQKDETTSSFLTHTSSLYESGEALLRRILAERRQNWQGRGKYKEPATLDNACLPELPEGWGVAPLEAIADVIDPNPSHRMPKYVPEGIPLVSSENFVGTEEIDFAIGKQVTRETLEQQRSRYTIEEGDFVLSRIGTIGKTRFLPTDKEYCLSHALVVLKVRSKSINKRWLRKTIASESILSQAHKGVQSVGVPDLGMAKIRDFIIPLPPLAEQTRIVAEVERRLSVVEELESVVTANLQRATRLRQSILQKAFAGELV